MPEVAVVGGGVMGASIAYHLAAAGIDDVVLYERESLASGPTGRSTALIRLHYSQPLLARMAAAGLALYSSSRTAAGFASGFTRVGLLVGAPEEERGALEHNVGVVRGEGAESVLLSAEDVAQLEPRLRTEGLVFAFEPGAGYCDPFLVTAGFAEAARRAGVSILEGSRVDSLDSLDARVVVVAAGPWSPPLLRQAGYELPTRVAPAEVGRFRLPPAFGSPPPAFADFTAAQLYFVPRDGGILEVGGLDPEHAEHAIDPDECPEGASRETLAGYRRGLVARLRGAEHGHWRGSWSAVYDVTPDWHPAIGYVAENVIVAAGFSGHGFKLAPAVGVIVAELVRDGHASSYDIGLLDPERFARDELVTTTYGYSVLG
jgi:glycine/D-amino acid oxidase-like deaminating enzyme